MLTINLFDSTFPHQTSVVAGKTAQHVLYVRNQMEWNGITIFTDQQMFSPAVDEVKSTYKVGWLIEGKELRPHHYELSKDVRHKFDFILTYDPDLLALDENKYRFTIRGGVWTQKEEWGMHPKNKTVSMIVSEKYETSGHKLRQMIADTEFGIDVYGAKGTPIGVNKAIAYKDYRYAVVVEASCEYNFFTEHLLDCIAFGTVPIYWGCPNIGIWLNSRGLIPFKTTEELQDILQGITVTRYEMMMPALKDNLARLNRYEITDDWLYRVYFEPLMSKSVGI